MMADTSEPMRHPLNVPGFEGRTLEIDAGAFVKRLYVDGSQAAKGNKLGQMLLRRNDGREVIAKWTPSFDPAPSITIDGAAFRTAPPLAWYQWLVVGAPLCLLFIGGALGGLCGALAATANAQLVRSSLPAALRYAGAICLTLFATAVYVAVAGALQAALR
jgi:hypothetical protein